MKKMKKEQFLQIISLAVEKISKLKPAEKTALEKSWDVEHAYYSSTLEGSKLDREEFEKLAKKIA